MATFSTREPFTDYPTANVFSMADGPVDKSSGIPYFYLTEMELSVHDLNKNNKASITMSLAQGDYCKDNNLDPEDPRYIPSAISNEIGPIMYTQFVCKQFTFIKTFSWKIG